MTSTNTPSGDGEPVEYRQARFRLPAGATELLLIRHGESAPAHMDRPFALVDGHGDPELASDGRHQAECVARRLATTRIDAIYVTTLRRTAETAAPLAARLGLTPRVSADLREVYLGDWEGGLFRQRVAQDHPIAQRMRAEQRWDVIPGAESTDLFAERVRRGVQSIAACHADSRVALFTHGGVIAQILAECTGSRPFAFIGADNGSISTVVISERDWLIRGYNDVSHLT